MSEEIFYSFIIYLNLNSQKGNDKTKTNLFLDQTQEIINALWNPPPGISYNH